MVNFARFLPAFQLSVLDLLCIILSLSEQECIIKVSYLETFVFRWERKVQIIWTVVY